MNSNGTYANSPDQLTPSPTEQEPSIKAPIKCDQWNEATTNYEPNCYVSFHQSNGPYLGPTECKLGMSLLTEQCLHILSPHTCTRVIGVHVRARTYADYTAKSWGKPITQSKRLRKGDTYIHVYVQYMYL